MIPELYTRVVVNRDIPKENVMRGDVGVFIEQLPGRSDLEEGAILEMFNALGDSIGVVTVPLSAVEPLRADHIPSVRLAHPAG